MIDDFNQMIVPFYYESIEVLESGLLKVKRNGQFGLLDRFNEVLMETQFDEITEYNGPFIQLVAADSMIWYNPVDRKILWSSKQIGQ